jgi:hypothetical protein
MQEKKVSLPVVVALIVVVLVAVFFVWRRAAGPEVGGGSGLPTGPPAGSDYRTGFGSPPGPAPSGR